MNYAYREIFLFHALSQFDDLLLCVRVNYRLLDIDIVIEICQGFEFVLFVFDRHVVLIDTF